MNLRVKCFPLHISYIIPADHEQFCDEFSNEESEKAWKHIANDVEKYSDEMVEQWNKEIDNFLTYVSLNTTSRLIS